MPSNFDEKNAIVFWGQYPGNFETKFFPLRFEGILYNSVPFIIIFVSNLVSNLCKNFFVYFLAPETHSVSQLGLLKAPLKLF